MLRQDVPYDEETRLKLVAETPPDLKAIVDAYSSKLRQEAGVVVLIRYDFGVQLAEALKKPNKFGDTPIEHTAANLKVSPSQVEKICLLPKEYTRAEVKALAARMLPDGGYITPTHLMYLALVKNKVIRRQLTDRVFEQGLSTKELALEIAARSSASRQGAGSGRKPSVPRSPIAAAQQVAATFQALSSKFTVWKTALSGLSPDNSDNAVLEKMHAGRIQAETAQAELTDFLQTLGERISEVETVVASHRAGVKEASVVAHVEELELEGRGKGKKRRPAATR